EISRHLSRAFTPPLRAAPVQARLVALAVPADDRADRLASRCAGFERPSYGWTGSSEEAEP
ncbi:MAG TPA: hypothetical protein DFS52_06560, partial [Myxococcales bacterium]|nr:hypothetical protein [Myxococcales bacterium]